MIRHFQNKETQRLFNGEPVRQWKAISRVAMRKLEWLNAAHDLVDLRVPPGNRLEKLTGDRAGYYSIRINDQWRLCFEWRNGDAWGVEIVDYH
jgi:proteic killer suppression protein